MHSHLIRQLIKFSLTGVINTAVDFAILNLLILIFGLHDGDPKFIVFKTISAGVAIINSYFLNKFWVFRERSRTQGEPQDVSKTVQSGEAAKFIGISLIGLLINAVVASVVFSFGHTSWPTISAHLLANISSLVAIVVVMISNFIGYKFLVFKR